MHFLFDQNLGSLSRVLHIATLPMPFSILFIGKSTPITDAAFTAVDPTHWVLDVISLVGGAEFTNLKEVCLFLLQPNLPPDAALALYISVGEHRS